jgi:hypothetical protein
MKFFLLILLCIVGLSAAQDLLKSAAALELLDSVSAISESTFLAYPGLNDALSAETQGCFNSELIELNSGTSLLVHGYENFYPAYDHINPVFVVYDVTNDTLVEKSRLSAPYVTGQTNAVVSKNPNNLYVAYSPVSPILPYPPNVAPFLPSIYTINLHQLSQQGILNPVPSTVFFMSTLAANIYNSSIAYNGLGGISDDGEYLIGTYATGIGYPFVLTGQKLVILHVEAGGSSLIPVVTIDADPTGLPNMYSFPQGISMVKDSVDSNKYHLIAAMNSWNFSNVLGDAATMSYYVFNKSASSLVRLSTDPVNQYITGYSFDSKNGRVFAITNEADIGKAVRQQLSAPYHNGAADKNAELRAWSLNLNQGVLVYQGGIVLNQDGMQIRASNDGKVLAVTTAPNVVSDFFTTNLNPFSTTAFRYGANVLTMYSVNGNSQISLKQESSSSASPLSFCLSFNKAGDRLSVGGQPTYKSQNGVVIGHKDVQLYKVTKQQ